jgi:hypothetical protein
MFFSTMNSPLDNFWFSLIQQSNDNMMSLIHIYIYIYLSFFKLHVVSTPIDSLLESSIAYLPATTRPILEIFG